MTWRCINAIVAIAGLAILTAACSKAQTYSQQPGQTQEGSAAMENAGPRAGAADASCSDLPSADDLKKLLARAPNEGGPIGGMFDGRMEWAAVVNRAGQLCAVAVATADAGSAWLGSAAIAKAKAFTANAFSTDAKPLSTARLYTLAQPGHSLYGAGAANPFNPDCLATPEGSTKIDQQVCGGTIVFGGGLALYKEKTRVGGLGVSGDTACADHEIAKRVRHLAGFDPADGEFVDDIVYVKADGKSAFAHPVCDNTYRNGQKIGDETPAMGY